ASEAGEQPMVGPGRVEALRVLRARVGLDVVVLCAARTEGRDRARRRLAIFEHRDDLPIRIADEACHVRSIGRGGSSGVVQLAGDGPPDEARGLGGLATELLALVLLEG